MIKRRRQRVSPPGEGTQDEKNEAEESGTQHEGEGLSEAGYRSSWHGPIPELGELEPDGATGFTTRSSSHGNLQQKSKSRPRLKFFKRQSYTVNPSPPSSPSKSGQSGLKSLFQNIKRGKKSTNEEGSRPVSVGVRESDDNRAVRLIHSVSRDWNVSTESDSSQPESEPPIRTNPEIESTNHIERSDNQTDNQSQNEIDTSVSLQTLQRSQSDDLTGQTNRNSVSIPRSTSHPIHTFQIRSSRTVGNQSQSSVSIFGRTRARKSVINEVEENLTHPAIIVLLSVINFCLWMFLLTIKILGISAKISVRLWLWMLYTVDFIVRIFHRIFNQDPEKPNQNSDYSHIESKYLAFISH